MVFRILIDGREKIVKKDVPNASRQAENHVREEIINHYLEEENAQNVLIIERLSK